MSEVFLELRDNPYLEDIVALTETKFNKYF